MKKMSSLLFVCVAVACLISEIGAASKNSHPTTTAAPDYCQLPGYDVSELKSQDYWVANITGQPSACVDPADRGNCTYYFAFCHELHPPPAVSAANCDGAAVCQIGHANRMEHSYSLGMYTDDLQFFPGSDFTGFYMNVFSGSNITGCTTGISTSVRLQCNESAMWTTRNLTDFISVNAIHDAPNFGCQYEVTLQYSGACGSRPSNHSSRVVPTPTRGHMNHTKTMNFTSTHHAPHSTMTKHTSMNTSMHSIHPTTSHSAGNHSSTKHPHPPTSTSHSAGNHSSTKHPHPPKSTTMKPMPSSTPHPHPPTTRTSSTTHPHPHHSTTTSPPHPPPTKPTENPLEHKVSGLTAGVVIFALIAFFLVIALVGVIYYFLKRGGGKYSMVTNINDE